MVAGGGAHQTAAQLLRGEGEGFVHGSTDFERAHHLKAFKFQIDLASQGLIQRGDAQQGSADNVRGNAALGRLDILQCKHGKPS